MRYIAFCVLGALAALVVLIIQSYIASFNFVVPAVLGPAIQGTGFVLAVAGCLFIVQTTADTGPRAGYPLVGGAITALAFWAGGAWFKTSLAGPQTYALVAAFGVLAAVCACTLVNRIVVRHALARTAVGLLLILASWLAPASIEALFLRDLL